IKSDCVPEVVQCIWLLQDGQQEADAIFRFGGCGRGLSSIVKSVERALFIALADKLFGAVGPLAWSIASCSRAE
ncbi:MAG: hypothetical protein JO033_13005, partial [Acidobacteriaceae bacterium]|nr:hypothetical protein [Acidobacteriaceae bacterium]